ncbi:MAG: hypothetical protein Q4G71_07175 [Pseudomonadota bacterium]|nr:hypothetical protein [Pseudomonadota bacterium]
MSNGYLLNSATIRIFRRYKGSSEKGEIELHSGSWACGFSFRHGDELIFFAGPDGLVGATAVELPKAWLLKVLEVSGDSQSKGSAFAQSVKSAM